MSLSALHGSMSGVQGDRGRYGLASVRFPFVNELDDRYAKEGDAFGRPPGLGLNEYFEVFVIPRQGRAVGTMGIRARDALAPQTGRKGKTPWDTRPAGDMP